MYLILVMNSVKSASIKIHDQPKPPKSLHNLHKIRRGVVAPGALEVVGQLLPYVLVSADRAAPDRLAGRLINSHSLGRGLDIRLIISIGDARVVVEDLRLLDIEDKHRVSSEIDGLAHAAGDISICAAGNIQCPVGRAPARCKAVELINVAAGLETEAFEESERCLFAQDGDREHARLKYHVVGEVRLVNGD